MAAPDPVFTLSDLDSWSFDGTALAVLGHPIKHSISPPMHNAALATLARTEPRFRSWKYFRFDIPPAELPAALALLHSRRFLGLNLTLPHKVLALPHLAGIDPAAQTIGAVNTLHWKDRGWHGYNTDGHGLAAGLREGLGLDILGATVILLGAGGAARGAAVECLRRGCASLWIANRTPENLQQLLNDLRPVAGSVPLHGFTPNAPPAGLPPGAIVINATSAGLRDSDPLPIDLGALPSVAGVYDMIYNPAETALLRAAKALGLPHANGLSMLVHQGAQALSIWTETDAPVDAMRSAALQSLAA